MPSEAQRKRHVRKLESRNSQSERGPKSENGALGEGVWSGVAFLRNGPDEQADACDSAVCVVAAGWVAVETGVAAGRPAEAADPLSEQNTWLLVMFEYSSPHGRT